MPETPHLPEFARSLRSLGASGSVCLHDAHEAIFIPLLDARKQAVRGAAEDAVDAMNGHAILGRIEAAVKAAATRGVTNAPRSRALAARAQDAIEPLGRALLALDEIGVIAGTEQGWHQWIEQLRRVFTTADDACQELASVLGDRDVHEPAPRWYSRATR